MGRGSSGLSGGGNKISNASIGGGNSAPALDKELIRRANDAGTFVDYGDATSRQYNKNVDEINTMDLTAVEKSAAYKELHSLTEKQLEAEAGARSPYATGMGPARFNQRQVQRSSDKAARARQDTANFMDNLRKEQKAKAKQREMANLTKALNDAIKSGALSVTVNGKTYTRKSTRSKTFTA